MPAGCFFLHPQLPFPHRLSKHLASSEVLVKSPVSEMAGFPLVCDPSSPNPQTNPQCIHPPPPTPNEATDLQLRTLLLQCKHAGQSSLPLKSSLFLFAPPIWHSSVNRVPGAWDPVPTHGTQGAHLCVWGGEGRLGGGTGVPSHAPPSPVGDPVGGDVAGPVHGAAPLHHRPRRRAPGAHQG